MTKPSAAKRVQPPVEDSNDRRQEILQVAADLFAGSALWRYPDMTTTVLRMCYTLGPAVQHGELFHQVSESANLNQTLGRVSQRVH